MNFCWKPQENGSHLSPSAITVRQEGHFWNIYVNDCRLMPGNYTSEQGGKMDAWQFALSKRRALFGAYRIRLYV
jgi:hypothetical protein